LKKSTALNSTTLSSDNKLVATTVEYIVLRRFLYTYLCLEAFFSNTIKTPACKYINRAPENNSLTGKGKKKNRQEVHLADGWMNDGLSEK
jgi:hypothetical protein